MAGLTIDKYEAAGNLESLFIILTVVIFILALLQMICLALAKSSPLEGKDKSSSTLGSVKAIIKNKSFMQILIISTIWAVANNITTPFLSTYQINELGFSMSFISTVTVVLNFLNVLAVYLVGKYSIKHSYALIFKASYVFGIIGFLIIIFTNTANGHVLFTIYRIFIIFFGATAGISSNALIFSEVE